MILELLGDDGVVTDHLNLEEIDPVQANNFDSMIKEAFAEGKHFFIARISTR